MTVQHVYFCGFGKVMENIYFVGARSYIVVFISADKTPSSKPSWVDKFKHKYLYIELWYTCTCTIDCQQIGDICL